LTPAQLYCLLAGLGLLLAGIFGFIADSTFDTSGSADTDAGGNGDGQLQGDSFLGFEVNGWHNVVHLLSGLVLLAAFRKRKIAKTVALAFGLTYGLVALIGLIDGNDVLGFIPVNGADNILHLALSALGIIAALISRGDDDGLHTSTGTGQRSTGRRADTSDLVRNRNGVTGDRTEGSGRTAGLELDRDRGGDRDRDDRFDRGQELDPRDLNPHDGTPTDGAPGTQRRTL
jgi:hypothetical protein